MKEKLLYTVKQNNAMIIVRLKKEEISGGFLFFIGKRAAIS
ncbi:hypothetical protein RR47_GL000636 [Enterococcus columbae DSM 7374 = ATCC 51263]|nr:hypothetical protein RR47_GL000636 [Enterococcus columbae DSM 7374 = ATCC 51263]